MKTITVALAVPAALLAFSACGGDDEPDTVSFGAEGRPACEDVWVVGQELDLNEYEGCDDGDTVVVAVSLGWEDGRGGFCQEATYEDRLWVMQRGVDEDGNGGTPGTVTDIRPTCEENAPTEEPTDETEAAPATIEVDCPEGLQDGTYTLQPNGRYVFSDGNDVQFTLPEVEAMNASYGCEVID
ncbi:MAG TPA: hypothetical protein VD814_01385 [Nocardioides sp.]|nr:hypothetical protein [Nocardioides sp.]